MKQNIMQQHRVTAIRQTEGQRVPMLGRMLENCTWLAYHICKNSRERQFGVGQLEWLKSYYSDFTQVARQGGQDRLTARYELRMRQARALLIKVYTRLSDAELGEKNYSQAKNTIKHARMELGTDVPLEIDREENRILMAEGLRNAECGLLDLAIEDINNMKGIEPEKKDKIALIVRQKAQEAVDGNGHKSRQYTADEILTEGISK